MPSPLDGASEEARSLLREALFGSLALSDGSGPFAFPVSFALMGSDVVFHSGEGRKSQAIERDPRASLTIASEPRLVLAPKACGCTFDYFSVLLGGEARLLTDLAERQEAMLAMVEKFRPDDAREFYPEHPGRTLVYVLDVRTFTEKSHRR